MDKASSHLKPLVYDIKTLTEAPPKTPYYAHALAGGLEMRFSCAEVKEKS